jgi:hypothetical protein
LGWVFGISAETCVRASCRSTGGARDPKACGAVSTTSRPSPQFDTDVRRRPTASAGDVTVALYMNVRSRQLHSLRLSFKYFFWGGGISNFATEVNLY